EERALDRLLVRTGLDVDAVLQEDVGSTQDILALIRGVGDMMQTTIAATALFGADRVVGLVVAGEPDTTEPTIIQLDHLGDARAQAGLHELAELTNILAQQIDVIEPTRRNTLRMEAAGIVLQCRLVGIIRNITTRVVVDLEDVAERIFKLEGLVAAMADVALDPADHLVLRGLDCLD